MAVAPASPASRGRGTATPAPSAPASPLDARSELSDPFSRRASRRGSPTAARWRPPPRRSGPRAPSSPPATPEPAAIPEPDDAPIRIRRLRRPWTRTMRRYDDVPDLLAAAEAQLTEQ